MDYQQYLNDLFLKHAKKGRIVTQMRATLGALPIVLKALMDRSNKKIRVITSASASTGSTDLKSKVVLPRVPLPTDENDVDSYVDMAAFLYGLIHHEVGHINDTTPGYMEKCSSPLQRHLLNCIEDIRQENLHIRRFPAARAYLNALAVVMRKKGLLDDIKETDSPIQIFTGFLLYRLYAEFRNEPVAKEIYPSAKRAVEKVFPEGFITRINPIIARFQNVNSTHAAYVMSEELMAFLKKEDEDEQQRQKDNEKKQSKQQRKQRNSQSSGNSSQDQDTSDGDTDPQDSPDQNGQSNQRGQHSGSDGSNDQDDEDGQASSGDDDSDQDAGDDADDTDQSTDPDQSNQDDPNSQDTGDDDQSGDSDQDGKDDPGGQNTGDQDQSDPSQNGKGAGGSKKPPLSQLLDQPDMDDAVGDIHETARKQLDDMVKDKAQQPSYDAATETLLGEVAKSHEPLVNGTGHDLRPAMSVSGPLRRKMLSQLDALTHPHKRASNKGRKLSSRHITRIVSGDPRVFEVKDEGMEVDTAVLLLQDVSGSMSGKKVQVAAQALYATSLAMTGIDGLDLSAMTFPGNSIVLRPNENPRRLQKRFELGVWGGTPMTEAVQLGTRMLQASNKARRIMIVLTDGQPDNFETAATALAVAQSIGIEVYGIGILTPQYRDLFQRWETISDLQELPEKLSMMVRDKVFGSLAA